MNEITINDLYNYKSDYSYLNEVLEYALKKLAKSGVIFSITFVDEAYIQELNKSFRGIDAVTDVISFAFQDSYDKINTNMLGDIFICIPRMLKQASDYGHSEKRELAFLSVHGLLHLLGYDHMNKADEEVMFNLQDEILRELNINR